MHKWQSAMCAFRRTRPPMTATHCHEIRSTVPNGSIQLWPDGRTVLHQLGARFGHYSTGHPHKSGRTTARVWLRTIPARDHDNSDLAAAEP